MKWARVKGMKLTPYRCIGCACTPQGENGPEDAYFAEGVDVNWGDSVYLCSTCVRILGELRGMVDVKEVEKIKKQNQDLKSNLEETRKEHEALKSKVERMLDGAKARKEAKAAVNV